MLGGGVRQRFGAGWSRLRSAPRYHLQLRPVPLENPAIILMLFLVLSVPLMMGSDYPVGRWMQQFPEELQPFAHTVTDLGEGVQVLVASGALLLLGLLAPVALWRRRVAVGVSALTAGAAFVFLSVAGGGLAALMLKYAIGRARPSLLDTHGNLHFQPFAMHSDFSAFPSGHSATAAAMAVSLALVFPRLRALFLATGVLICASRQFVGMHWMSDTLMGWAVGAAFTFWMAHVFARRGLMFTYDALGRLTPRRSRFNPLAFATRLARSSGRSARSADTTSAAGTADPR